MTDKELLELAAKAAEIDARRLPDAWPNRFDDDQWNPLIDDGDALRLAVKLGLYIAVDNGIKETIWNSPNWKRGAEPHNDDPYAATRRAIVRAAAEIGKSMGGV